mgnify:CR=1 FL=1|jgi:hypothetical protein
MKKKHILIEKAFNYTEKKIDDKLSECKYLIEKGYWILNETGEALMSSANPLHLMTKKEDIETGEDHKGE